VEAGRFDGKVALVTGGANGIGAAVARRLAGQGARIVVADVDTDAGETVAKEVDGVFVHCDVGSLDDNRAAVATATDRFGGLDIVALNAGVSTGFGLEDDFDSERYRRIMGINLDGVVFGAHAALPALKARGGGDIIATASLAGLVAMPMDPVYGANKAAVVGLVRALGPAWEHYGVRVNGLCPAFAETAIVVPIRELLEQAGVPLIPVEAVVDTFVAALTSGRTGECWFVQPGRPGEPYQFRGVPGPLAASGERAPAMEQ
jgi:NAD(P)-dependent dehydrogenase (short-subunit alcohol dehydrogenase family)